MRKADNIEHSSKNSLLLEKRHTLHKWALGLSTGVIILFFSFLNVCYFKSRTTIG